MKRALIYARVSTEEQADKGYSLPSQIEACKRYAALLGYEVVEVFADDYSGATPIAERPEGRKMVAALKQKQASAVLAYQVDRLSRDTVDLLASVRDWLRRGICGVMSDAMTSRTKGANASAVCPPPVETSSTRHSFCG